MRPFAMIAAIALVAAPAAAALAPGARAPDFTTRGARDGNVVDVHLAAALKKGPVVLYFFPAAFTGGCNAEAHAFSEAIPDFQRAGATVIGMSADDIPTLQRFSREKCAGKFTVASAGPRVVAAYGVQLPTKIAGRAITSRTSFVIGRNHKVVFVHDEMKADNHVALTLAAVRKLHQS